MASTPDVEKSTSLAEQYMVSNGTPIKIPEKAAPENVVTEETLAVTEEGNEVAPSTADESSEPIPVASEESSEVTPAVEDISEDTPAAAEEENSGDEEVEQTPDIKLETAPADFRFPTTNQTRHCFTRYIEYHRCIAAKGEGASECDKFAKFYRSLCPSEWVERWNEQRENGTFPGPL